MNDYKPGQERLQEAMRAWAAQAARLEPPQEVADAVLRHFGESPLPKRGWRRSVTLLGTAAAVAASLAIAMLAPDREPPVPLAASEAPFIALPYVIQPAAYEPTEVVRTEVLAAELMAVGLPVKGDPNARVEAEILVGQDGRARAVRLISDYEMGISE